MWQLWKEIWAKKGAAAARHKVGEGVGEVEESSSTVAVVWLETPCGASSSPRQ